jgi:hypothetical protein
MCSAAVGLVVTPPTHPGAPGLTPCLWGALLQVTSLQVLGYSVSLAGFLGYTLLKAQQPAAPLGKAQPDAAIAKVA